MHRTIKDVAFCIFHRLSEKLSAISRRRNRLEIASGLRLLCFMLIQRYPVYQCDHDGDGGRNTRLQSVRLSRRAQFTAGYMRSVANGGQHVLAGDKRNYR